MADDEIQWRQIELCRILSIALMMTVHINPGSGGTSFVNAGPAWPLGWLAIDVLGRASVAGLSFISGYLLSRSFDRKSVGQLARGKFQTLLVPMWTWNGLYVLALLAQLLLLGMAGAGYKRLSGDWFGGLTGISGHTADDSLFFLRDLFVSTVLLRLALPLVRTWPLTVLGGILVLTLFDLTAPIVFRPTILLFLVAGFVFAQRGGSLLRWARIEVVVGSALALAILLVVSQLGNKGMQGASFVAADIAKRMLLTILFVSTCGFAAKLALGARLAPLGRHMFLTYLSHQIVFGIIWYFWVKWVGRPGDASYLLYFLAMPFVAIAAGTALGTALDGTPALVQVVLRGKARKGRSAQLAPGTA